MLVGNLVKNNSLAMLATIAIVLSLAALIGYVEPSACTVPAAEGLPTCEESAAARLWASGGLFTFGVVTLLIGTIRNRKR